MEISDMLDLMFEDGLTDAEVKAIAKTRGFPVGSGASRSAVKNLFLSTIGIEEALASLEGDELTTLRMLAEQEAEPDITFFERLYHQSNFSFREVFHLSFNQRYGEIFKTVRQNLVRKGILMMAANRFSAGTRLEQWRFAVPPAVIERLPPQIKPFRLENGPQQQVNTQALTNKLLELAGVKQTDPLVKEKRYQLTLEKNLIKVGNIPLDETTFFEWQVNNWGASISIKMESSTHAEHPVLAIIMALASLQPNEWFLPRQLTSLLKIRCFGIQYPKVEEIIEEGWKWGLLDRREHNGQVYYSPRFMHNPRNLPVLLPALPDPAHFIKQKNGKSWVELEHVPAVMVTTLNGIANLELVGKNLFFTPNPARLANLYPRLVSLPLAMWMVENLPEFKETYAYIQKGWGKTLMHTNLYIARITNFSLMVQIERAFRPGIDYVHLSDQWIAFCKDLLPEVERLAKKSEFVVKKVKA